jgi:hypothetical protein
MKINFRKISAMAASALMIGMTMGAAAAASFPAPFSGSTSDGVAIVSGTGTGVDDTVAVNSISNYLATKVKASGGSVTGGDSLKIEKSSTKVNLGDTLDSVWGSAITDSNLPELLADGTYMNDENNEYPYTQKINLGSALNFTHFADSDYMDKDSSIGFHLASATHILNYTLDWTTSPESDVNSAGDLADIETTDMTILGKSYYVLDMDNSTLAMTLLDAASSTTLSEGESTTLSVGGKSYEVSINFIGSSSVKLDISIDGAGTQTTNSLSSGGTQKLSDGSYVGIKEILTQDYAGGTKTVEFSIGNGKLEILNGSAIELNDVSVDDITGYVYKATASGGKEKLDKLVLSWRLEDEAFLTPSEELLMPGFEAIKLSMGPIVYPAEEETIVEYSGDDVKQIKTTIADGDVTIPILKSSTTTGNFTYIGKDSDERLATSNNSLLYYNAASGQNEGFVVSWNNSRDSESYYLEASVSRDSSTKANKTTIKNKVTGVEICKDYETNDVCTIGNVELTVTAVKYHSSSNRHVNLTVNTEGSFSRLYTAEGLEIYLPYGSAQNVKGGLNSSASSVKYGNAQGVNATLFTLWFHEEDRNEDLGAGNFFNFTIDTTGTTPKAYVSNVYGAKLSAAGGQETERSSKIYEYFIEDDVATNILWDKTNSDQYEAKVIYHGAEVSADVYLTAPGAQVGEVGNMVFTDAEKSSWQSRDVVLVGGSCINSATATALGVAYPTCEAAFTSATGIGSGQYLIQSVGNAFTSGKIALVVAGYSKADTAAAAQRLANLPSTIDTTAGNKYLGIVGVTGDSTISKIA